MQVLSEFGGNSLCLRQKLVQRRLSRRQLHLSEEHIGFEQRQPSSLMARMASSNREVKEVSCPAKRSSTLR